LRFFDGISQLGMLFQLDRMGDGVREPPDTILKFSDSFDDFGSRYLRSHIFVELNFAFAFFNVLADSRSVVVNRMDYSRKQVFQGIVFWHEWIVALNGRRLKASYSNPSPPGPSILLTNGTLCDTLVRESRHSIH